MGSTGSLRDGLVTHIKLLNLLLLLVLVLFRFDVPRTPFLFFLVFLTCEVLRKETCKKKKNLLM